MQILPRIAYIKVNDGTADINCNGSGNDFLILMHFRQCIADGACEGQSVILSVRHLMIYLVGRCHYLLMARHLW